MKSELSASCINWESKSAAKIRNHAKNNWINGTLESSMSKSPTHPKK
jgi:hypothetical protein